MKVEGGLYAGERPFYRSRDLELRDVVTGEGESALKECAGIVAEGCTFEGRYPIWECSGVELRGCRFGDDARAALWYCNDVRLEQCVLDSPKSFREIHGLKLRDVRVNHGVETLWRCHGVDIEKAVVSEADNVFMGCEDVCIKGLVLHGKYSFQYTRNVTIEDSELYTKDAFWETENVTVRNSIVAGEYLGWYSRGLTLIGCRISGTQPLCYCEGLKLMDCTFDSSADLAFEYSSVEADIRGTVTSVKNPRTGYIRADSIGEVILDENIKQPADCRIISASVL